MTHQEWLADPEMAVSLKQILENPVLKIALEILRNQSMAKAMDSQALAHANNIPVMFGYDVGRESVFTDLVKLSTPIEIPKPIKHTYQP